MSDNFISDTQLAARFDVSRNTIWRWAREQADFPKPVKLTPGCTRWREADIDRWVAAQTEAVS